MSGKRLLAALVLSALWWGGSGAERADAVCATRGRRCSTPPTRPGGTAGLTERQLAAVVSRLAPGERVVVPVVYHFVYNAYPTQRGDDPDDVEHLPPVTLAPYQTQALNRAFRGTAFSFLTAEAALLDFAPWRHDQRGSQPPTVDELTAMVREASAERAGSLHVFLVRDVENRAASPDTRSMFENARDVDGILMNRAYLPVLESLWPAGAKDPVIRRLYSEGQTLVHLVGHYFGLQHTFEPWPDADPFACGPPKCGQITDHVRDTPVHLLARVEMDRCYALDTCPNLPGLDPVHNFMNFVPDFCANEFTPGQVERMERMVRFYRPYLIVPGAAGSR